MGEGGQAFRDGPETIKTQRIQRQASQAGENPNAVGFSIAVCVLPQLGVTGPVPAVLNAPTIANVSEKCAGAGAQTCDVVAGFIHRHAIAAALAANLNHRAAARPVLYHPVRGRHTAQCPGDVAAMADLMLAGLEQSSLAIGQPIHDFLKSLAAAMFYRDQEVCAALFKVDEKGRLACSASA